MSSRSPEFDARAAWNAGMHAGQHFVRSGSDYYRTLVQVPRYSRAACPAGPRAVDLVAPRVASHANWRAAVHEIVGAYVSEGLLEFARSREDEEPYGIEYGPRDALDSAPTVEGLLKRTG